jgi:hypothetical protein
MPIPTVIGLEFKASGDHPFVAIAADQKVFLTQAQAIALYDALPDLILEAVDMDWGNNHPTHPNGRADEPGAACLTIPADAIGAESAYEFLQRVRPHRKRRRA